MPTLATQNPSSQPFASDFAPLPPNPYLPSHPVSPSPEHLDTTSVVLIIAATLLGFIFAIAWVVWHTCGAAARAEEAERSGERQRLLVEKRWTGREDVVARDGRQGQTEDARSRTQREIGYGGV
nr:hypothetical protein CFP56_00649 [Quercus suber]